MWLKTVRVLNWGGFGEPYEVELDRAMTVITGENESGKTSLASAVFVGLFGTSSSAPQLPQSGDSRVELEFTDDTRTVRLKRDLRTGRVQVAEIAPSARNLFDGRPESAAADWKTVISDLVGLSDGAPWARSGFVLQGELGEGMDPVLKSWISGNGQFTWSAACEALEAELGVYTGETGNGPGSLEELNEDLALRRAELERWETQAEAARASAAELRACEERLAATGDAASESDQMLNNLLRFQELVRERGRLEDSLGHIRQERDRTRKQVEAAEVVERKLAAEFPDFINAPDDLEDVIHAWMESSTRLRHLGADQERAAKALSELPMGKTQRNGLLLGGGLAVLGWLACWGAGAALIGLAFVPIFAALGYGGVWYVDKGSTRIRMERELECHRLRDEREEMERQERDSRHRLGMLGRYSNPLILRKEFRRYLEARTELERACGARDGQRPLEEANAAYEHVLAELQVVDTQTRDLVVRVRYLSGLDTSPELLADELTHASAREEQQREELEALAERAEVLRGEVARMETGAESPAHIAEDIERLEAQAAAMTLEVEALTQALAGLRQAMESYQETHLERVAASTAAYMKAFSMQRFTAVRFTSDLDLEVMGENGWNPDRTLSRGTRDQLLLALRLAVHVELCGESGLPVVLDEAFHLWDDSRLEQARQVLVGLTERGAQVVVLSRDARLEGWSDSSVHLEHDPSRRRAA